MGPWVFSDPHEQSCGQKRWFLMLWARWGPSFPFLLRLEGGKCQLAKAKEGLLQTVHDQLQKGGIGSKFGGNATWNLQISASTLVTLLNCSSLESFPSGVGESSSAVLSPNGRSACRCRGSKSSKMQYRARRAAKMMRKENRHGPKYQPS